MVVALAVVRLHRLVVPGFFPAAVVVFILKKSRKNYHHSNDFVIDKRLPTTELKIQTRPMLKFAGSFSFYNCFLLESVLYQLLPQPKLILYRLTF
jgi:hypothetical protein